MRSTQCTEDVILCLLREAAAGTPIDQVCSSARISTRTFYRWRAQYGGLSHSAARERNDLLHENIRLRSLVEELWQKDKGGTSPERSVAVGSSTPPTQAAREARSSGRYASVRGQR